MASNFIPYGRQSISPADIESVVSVLRSLFLTQGPMVEHFEQAVAEFCGAKYAVAVNSATSALHIACLAAGLESGDHHWSTPNTFVASSNCGLYCGAKVDFVDIDSRTYNMSPEKLREKLEAAKKAGRLPKTLIPVDFAGQSAALKEIYEIAKSYGITVIEDASHAVGGSYRGEKVGSCRYSDMTVFSFHPVKIVTTGEGGIVLTNNADLYERLIRFRSHGITRDPKLLSQPGDGPWSYEQIDLGYNYRMTDISAALGLSQMGRIQEFVDRRKVLVTRYNKALEGLPITLPYQHPDTDPAWHLYVIRLQTGKAKLSRSELYNALKKRGIIPNVHYIPVHWQPYYRKLGFERGQFPEAESYYNEALSIPLFVELTEKEQDVVISAIREALS